mgnify:CR=1 FL=1
MTVAIVADSHTMCPCTFSPLLPQIDFLSLSYTRAAEDVREARRCVRGGGLGHHAAGGRDAYTSLPAH